MDSSEYCHICALHPKGNHFTSQCKYLQKLKQFVVERNKNWKSEAEEEGVTEEDVEDVVLKPTEAKGHNPEAHQSRRRRLRNEKPELEVALP